MEIQLNKIIKQRKIVGIENIEGKSFGIERSTLI